MKARRFQYKYREGASGLHKAVGDALRDPSGPFALFKIYQEYPVNKINPDYPNGRHKFDWVIKDLGIVFEVMGEQHYKPVSWSKEDGDSVERFRLQQIRDKDKEEAAQLAGYTYVIVPYTLRGKITANVLYDLYLKEVNNDT